jgi:hypothetical protein
LILPPKKGDRETSEKLSPFGRGPKVGRSLLRFGQVPRMRECVDDTLSDRRAWGGDLLE